MMRVYPSPDIYLPGIPVLNSIHLPNRHLRLIYDVPGMWVPTSTWYVKFLLCRSFVATQENVFLLLNIRWENQHGHRGVLDVNG